MTNEEILKTAIEKAIEKGWEFQGGEPIPQNILGYARWLINTRRLENIIFSHPFTKAFWGEAEKPEYQECCPEQKIHYSGCCQAEEDTCLHCDETLQLKPYNKGWKYHSQEMVVSNDPIQYLEKFL